MPPSEGRMMEEMAQELAAQASELSAMRGPSEAAVTALSTLKNEPDWMRSRRLEALATYEATDPPKWQYMDSRLFKVDNLAPYAAATAWDTLAHQLPADIQQLVDGEIASAGYAIQVDSDVVRYHLDPQLAEQGVILTSMEDAVANHTQLVQEHFMQGGGVKLDDDHFVALHAALWSGGLFFYVPKDVEVKEPVYFYHTITNGGAMTQPHNMIIIDRHATANIYEEYFAPVHNETEPYSGANTFFHLKDGSQTRAIVVQRWGDNLSEVSKHQAFVGRDARINITTALVGGNRVQKRVRAELQGTGANSEMHAMVLAAGEQKLDLVTENRHKNTNTHGDMVVKQVLRDESRTSFLGLIHIDSKAPQSTDFLSADSLVLDPGAASDAIPGLEIYNDDVQASHGATIGEVDEGQLFYLMSRGVPRDDAELMIVEGFFNPLLERVPEENIRERLGGFITDKVRRK